MILRLAGLAQRVLPAPLAGKVDTFLARSSDDQLAAGGTALWAFTLRVAGAAIAYLSQILLARWMGIFEYGIFVVVYVWITILSQIANLGFSSSVIRFIPEFQARNQIGRLWGIMRASRIIAVISACAFASTGAGIILLFPGIVDSHYAIPIVLGAVCLPLFCLTEVQDGIARSFTWSDLAFGPTYIWRPLAILATMVAAHELDFPMTAVTACVCAIIATWATAVLQMLLISRRTARTVQAAPAEYDVRSWLWVSLPILLSDGFYALLTSIDVVMLSHYGTPDQVAVYYAATKTLALVHFVYYAVRAASGPRYAFHYHSGNQQALADMVRTSIRWAFWPSVAMSTVVLLVGEFLLSLFGADFVGGGGLLIILVFGILARASVGPVETLLTMSGRQGACAAVFGIAFVINVALNFLLIPAYGLYGAATATALAMVAETVMVMIAVRHYFGFTVWVFRLDRAPQPVQPQGPPQAETRPAEPHREATA